MSRRRWTITTFITGKRHEVAHAAQHVYGLDYDDGRPVGEHMDSANEAFAHLYGELFQAVWGCVQEVEHVG